MNYLTTVLLLQQSKIFDEEKFFKTLKNKSQKEFQLPEMDLNKTKAV